MAETKYFEAQSATEVLLTLNDQAHRQELLGLYLEILSVQKKKIPSQLIIEFAKNLPENQADELKFWLSLLQPQEIKKHILDITLLKLKLAEGHGMAGDIYSLLSHFQSQMVEHRTPILPEIVVTLTQKYFKNDFHLKLQQLAIRLMLSDYAICEKLIQDLIHCTIEVASPKGIREKFLSLGEVIQSGVGKTHFEVYRNLCALAANGIQDKKDYKRLVEIIIFVDSSKLQALVLNILDKHPQAEVAQEYAQVMKQTKGYDFVYFDKFYPQLKKYFVKPKEIVEPEKPKALIVDLKLDSKNQSTSLPSLMSFDSLEDEQHILHVLKHQDYSAHELNELATSFLQSDLPRAALKAAEKALKQADDNVAFLKACYLCFICHMQLSDFRAALDLSMQALSKAQDKNDILSFLYGQAEAQLRLGKKKEARIILEQILGIDEQYRLTKERLEKLNEV